MPTTHRLAIHWFRRDLRLTDNTALHHAAMLADWVVPVYVISAWQGRHRWTGPPRQQFLCGCLESLEQNIAAAGGQLVFRRGHAADELEKLIRETGADGVFTNRDPDPFGIAIEREVARRCRELNASFKSFKDTVLHEGDEILARNGEPYRIFTAYNKTWQVMPKAPVLPAVKALRTPAGIASLPRPSLKSWALPECDVLIHAPGERAGRTRMKHALKEALPHYAERRNFMHGQTTSRISAELRHGTVSAREIYHRTAKLIEKAPNAAVGCSLQTFLNELAWREFFMQVLWHWPEVLAHEFDPQFRGLPWDYDEVKFRRWKDGMTGFPIVDAGMRQLRATGFMHNRARMITAMFLTKDLHLDWRLGEEHFMQSLVDGEIASNNGGWQWSAGTGADAAPYFRIQNPWSQTKAYDPEGHYIRQWVPELKDVPVQLLWSPPPGGRGSIAKNYPPPMVDHRAERERTLAIFKKHRERMGA